MYEIYDPLDSDFEDISYDWENSCESDTSWSDSEVELEIFSHKA